jgi:hypothetical protein
VKLSLAADLTADLSRLVDSRMLVAANSGGGKSWLLRLVAEQAAGKVQVVILDPEGEFASLREKFDFLLVGSGGEVPAEPRAAGLLARRVMELQASAIVDLADLKLADKRRFVRLFLESLMALPKDLWRPLVVMIDEAHLFCPERSAGEAESTDAVIALMSLGRKRGYCGVLATQRLSKLHKDAEAEANNVFVGRCWLDVDQKRAGALLGMDANARQDLRDLQAGEFVAFGPALSGNGITRFRSNPVQTTHPKAGHRHKLTPPKPSDAVKRLLKDLADLPQQAEAEVRDLAAAKAEITRLTKELARKPAPPVSVVDKSAAADTARQVKTLRTALEQAMKVVEKIRTAGFDGVGIDPDEVKKVIQTAADQIVKAAEAKLAARKAEFDRLKKEAGVVLDRLGKLLAGGDASGPVVVLPPSPIPVRSPLPTPSANGTGHIAASLAGDGRATGPEQRILDALRWLESIGTTEPENGAVAFVAGYTPTSTSYTNPRGQLKKQGLIEYPAGDLVRLTEAGRAAANEPEAAVTVAALHEKILGKLPGPEVRILKPLIEAYPNALSNEDCAVAAEYTASSTSYTNPRGTLKKLGLIEYPARDTVRARAILFPEIA